MSARQAEQERIAAEVRTQEERKRRQQFHRAAGLIASVLALGTGISSWQMLRAMNAEHAKDNELSLRTVAEGKARQEAEKAIAAEQATAQQLILTAGLYQSNAQYDLAEPLSKRALAESEQNL